MEEIKLTRQEFQQLTPEGIPRDDSETFIRMSATGYLLNPSDQVVEALYRNAYAIDHTEPRISW